MMVRRVLLVQRVVNYLLEAMVVVLIRKLCVVTMGNTAVLMVNYDFTSITITYKISLSKMISTILNGEILLTM